MSANTSFPLKAHSCMSVCSWYCSFHSRSYLQWHLSALVVLQRVIWNSLHPSYSAFISPNSWQSTALHCLCSSVFYGLLYSWSLTVNNSLLSLSTHSSFLHLFSWLARSCGEQNSIPLSGYSTVYSFTEGYLNCIQALTIRDKAAVNIHVQAFVWTRF